MSKPFSFAILLITLLLSLFVFQEINLTTADLGRHITNGNIFINPGDFNVSRSDLLYTNLFSYTHSEFPFVNHHFGSGVLFYLVYIASGFAGLSLFYGACIIASTLILFSLFKNKVSLLVSVPTMLFLIPLIASRVEVRPEGLSYLFLASVIALLYLYNANQISRRWLWSLPVLSLILVNVHIYFIFIPFIISLFLLESLIRKDFVKSKFLTLIALSSVLALCLNPSGIAGATYPFTIFNNYGYRIVENQSILFLVNLGLENPHFLWWGLASVLLILLSVLAFLKQRVEFPLALFALSASFMVLSFFSIRHFTLYGLSLVPLFLDYARILYNKPVDPERVEKHEDWSLILSALVVILTMINFNTRLPWRSNWGVGLMPRVEASAEFFETEGIEGPIFSNYDIGSYLIFHLYPRERVFVDNRPEAYPAEFLQDEYVRMQEDGDAWESALAKWGFNSIYFYRQDMTPWAQPFLIARIEDPLWAPVFVDDYTIILLRRNTQNASIIEKYELPRSMFVVK